MAQGKGPRMTLCLSKNPLEYEVYVFPDDRLPAQAAIVLGGRKFKIAAGGFERRRQMLEAPAQIRAGIGKAGAVTLEAQAAGRRAFDLEHAILAGATAKGRIIAGFDLGDAQGKPGRNAILGRHGLDHRHDRSTRAAMPVGRRGMARRFTLRWLKYR